jgi:hypothetical protein
MGDEIDPFAAMADEQISSPVRAQQRAAATRAEHKRLREIIDQQTQHRLWKEWRAKRFEQLMAGRYRTEVQKLMRFLNCATLEDGANLVSLIAAGPWSSADGDTRFLILSIVNSRIMELRTTEGLSPIDDALPDELPTASQLIRALLTEKGEL